DRPRRDVMDQARKLANGKPALSRHELVGVIETESVQRDPEVALEKRAEDVDAVLRRRRGALLTIAEEAVAQLVRVGVLEPFQAADVRVVGRDREGDQPDLQPADPDEAPDAPVESAVEPHPLALIEKAVRRAFAFEKRGGKRVDRPAAGDDARLRRSDFGAVSDDAAEIDERGVAVDGRRADERRFDRWLDRDELIAPP